MRMLPLVSLYSTTRSALCDDYMQLSARGTSVLYSSGDGGVSGAQSASCPGNLFVATFPSGCP